MLDTAWAQLAAIGLADWFAIITGATYALLAVRRSRWCWLAGATSSAVLIYVSVRAQLPMQAALQSFYVAMSIYGFWRWSRAGEDGPVLISLWPLRLHATAITLIAAVAWYLGPLLGPYTQAAWPRLDTAVMLGGLLATWMTAQAKLENWIYWIVIDVASIYLYFMQGAVGAALLYLVYTGIAVAGLATWLRQWRGRENGPSHDHR